jgi:hypothetical protein
VASPILTREPLIFEDFGDGFSAPMFEWDNRLMISVISVLKAVLTLEESRADVSMKRRSSLFQRPNDNMRWEHL